MRGRKHIPLFLVFERILTSSSVKSRAGLRWVCVLSSLGADALLDPALALQSFPWKSFLAEEHSLLCKVNVSSSLLLHSQEELDFHSAFLHSEDPAANYSSIY